MSVATRFEARQICDVGWLDEGYALTGSGRRVLSWNGDPTCLLHEATDGGVEPLCDEDDGAQVDPVAHGERVAFLAEDPTDVNALRLRVYDLGARTLHRPPVAASSRRASIAWLDHDHLLVPDASGRALLKVAADGSDRVSEVAALAGGPDPAPSVGPDGRVTFLDRTAEGPALELLDPDVGTARVLLAPSRGAVPVAAAWSPTGRHVLVLVRRQGGLRPVLLDLEAADLHALELPPLRGLPAWHPAGDRLLLSIDAWPFSRVAVFDLERSSLDSLPLPEGVMATDPAWHDGACHFVGYGPAHPPALWLWSDGDGARSLTPAQDIPGQAMPELVRLESGRGYELPALVYETLDGAPARKTIVMLHGGPADVWRVNWSPLRVVLAAAGYRLVLLDTRGGSFRGWPLPRVSFPELADAVVEDVLAAVSALVARGLAEPGAVAISGHSHGAFVAYLATLAAPDAFAAAVLTSGYLDPRDLLRSRDSEVVRFFEHCYGGRRNGDGELETACPLLVVHGDQDSQVPADALAASIDRLRGSDHELVVLPGEGHKFRRKENVSGWIERAVDFLGAHVPEGRRA